MRGPRVAAAVVVVVALLLGTQLAFTTVGQEVGEDWNGPVEVASIDSGPQKTITDIAATGGDDGAVAWIQRFGRQYTVHVARFKTVDGTVTVSDSRRVATAERELRGVGVARSDDELAVVWEDSAEDDIRLARVTDGGIERTTAADSFRLTGPAVVYAGGEPLVSWTGQPDIDAGFAVYAARPGGDPVGVGGPTHREHEPTLTAAGSRVSVAWFESRNDTAVVTRLRAKKKPSVVGTTVLGAARVRGSFGGSTRDVPFISSARNRSTVRVVWTDVGEVLTGTVAADGTGSEPRQVTQFGGESGVGTSGTRWTAAWTVPGGPTNDDAFYLDGEGHEGAVARLPGNENDPTPVYAPDPTVAWYSWGGDARVLLAAHDPGGSSGPVYRVTAAPQRFVFLSISAAALGLVTLPIMPWSLIGFFGAFVATTAFVSGPVLRFGARLTGATSQSEMRDRLEDLPTATWPVLFAAVEIPFTVWVIFQWTQLTSLGFAHPLPTSLGALVASVVVVTVLEIDSGWRATIVYAALQNAALWAIGGTTFL